MPCSLQDSFIRNLCGRFSQVCSELGWPGYYVSIHLLVYFFIQTSQLYLPAYLLNIYLSTNLSAYLVYNITQLYIHSCPEEYNLILLTPALFLIQASDSNFIHNFPINKFKSKRVSVNTNRLLRKTCQVNTTPAHYPPFMYTQSTLGNLSSWSDCSSNQTTVYYLQFCGILSCRFYVDDEEILKVEPDEGGMWVYGGLDQIQGYDNPWAGSSRMAPFDEDVSDSN